jgi:hypothetical protein
MPFPSIDDSFRNGIKDDYLVFDGKETLIIHHNSDGPQLNWTAGTGASTTIHTEVDNCLFRQPSTRVGPSVPQLHERAMAIQKDKFAACDTTCEVPMIDDLIISENDIIERPFDNTKWTVKMLDYATLRTRYRLGLMRLL